MKTFTFKRSRLPYGFCDGAHIVSYRIQVIGVNGGRTRRELREHEEISGRGNLSFSFSSLKLIKTGRDLNGECTNNNKAKKHTTGKKKEGKEGGAAEESATDSCHFQEKSILSTECRFITRGDSQGYMGVTRSRRRQKSNK